MRNTLRAITCCCWMIAGSLSGFSQKHGRELIDSLQKEIDRSAQDTNKVLLLMKLSGVWSVIDHDKCFPAVNEALQLAERLRWKRGIANAENNLGLFMSDTGNTIGSRRHFETSYKLNMERGSQVNVVNNLVNIGRTYSFESDFPKAMDYYFKALTVAEETKDEQKLALVCNNLASTYSKQHNAQKALEYGLLTLDHAAKAHDSSKMVKGLTFVSTAQSIMKDTLAAIHSLDSAIKIGREADLLVDVSDAMGDRALLESDLQKRIQWELDAEKLLAAVNAASTEHLANKANLGSDYLSLAKRSSETEKDKLLRIAEENLESARTMAIARNNPDRLADVLRLIVGLEEYQGRYKQALNDHERMTELKDSLFSQDSKNKIAGLDANHTVELKDAELKLSQLQISSQRKTTIGLVAGLALLALFGGLLYRQSNSRKKANAALLQANTELEEANRVKARFFGILSHDLRGPVASLLHFLEIQQEAPDLMNATQEASHRRQITDSAENLLNTMEGMLLWSKQQMESFRPSMKNISVEELFSYLKKFFGASSTIALDFLPAIGLIVFTDENYLRTIMQNLTSNAIKALKDRPDARIEWKAWKDNTNTILSISDNGPGMRPEHARVLYEDAVAENGRDGFGLHMTRDLAKAIQCRIDVETLPGKGTMFLLTISNAAVKDAAIITASKSATLPTGKRA